MIFRHITWIAIVMVSLIAAQAAMSGAHTAASAPETTAAFAELNKWSDGYEAFKQGQTGEYNQALRKAAESLSTLTDAEIRQRLLSHLDELDEAARWQSFIMTPQPLDCIRDMQWSVVKGDLAKLDSLVGTNLANIAVSFKPNARRDFQLVAIVQLEKEAPIIKTHRIDLAEKVSSQVYGLPMMKLSQSTVDQIRELAASK